MKIEKEFKPNAMLFFLAQREIYNSTKSSKVIYFLFLVVPLLVIFISLIVNKTWTTSCNFAVIAIVFVLIQLPLMQYLQIKKNLKSNKSASQLQNMTFTEEGLRSFGEGVDLNLSWDKILRIVRSKKFVLFYISDSCAYFIPSHLISNSEFEKISGWGENDV